MDMLTSECMALTYLTFLALAGYAWGGVTGHWRDDTLTTSGHSYWSAVGLAPTNIIVSKPRLPIDMRVAALASFDGSSFPIETRTRKRYLVQIPSRSLFCSGSLPGSTVIPSGTLATKVECPQLSRTGISASLTVAYISLHSVVASSPAIDSVHTSRVTMRPESFTRRILPPPIDCAISLCSYSPKCRSDNLSLILRISAWSTRLSFRSCSDRSMAAPAFSVAAASSWSEYRCNSSAFWAILDENSYSPTMPATTSTAKNIFAVLCQRFFSKNGNSAYSPRMPIASSRVDRPDQRLADLIAASSSSLVINPRYAYVMRRKWDLLVIGLLGIGVLVRAFYK
jgi:hypothetical protein